MIKNVCFGADSRAMWVIDARESSMLAFLQMFSKFIAKKRLCAILQRPKSQRAQGEATSYPLCWGIVFLCIHTEKQAED